MAPSNTYLPIVAILSCVVFSTYIGITRLIYETQSTNNVITMSVMTLILNSVSLSVTLFWIRRQNQEERPLLPNWALRQLKHPPFWNPKYKDTTLLQVQQYRRDCVFSHFLNRAICLDSRLVLREWHVGHSAWRLFNRWTGCTLYGTIWSISYTSKPTKQTLHLRFCLCKIRLL